MADLSHDLFQGTPPMVLLHDGRYGAPGAEGVRAHLLDPSAAASLVARKGAAEPLAARFAAAGLRLPDRPGATFADALTLVGTGPGRWLVLAEDQGPDDLLARLAALAEGAAALTDQSDANFILEISGPKAREALAKGVMLDLDPVAFGPGDVATTVVSHVGTTLWQTDAAPVYRFAVPGSFAPAFLRWLAASAAEFGFALSGAGRG